MININLGFPRFPAICLAVPRGTNWVYLKHNVNIPNGKALINKVNIESFEIYVQFNLKLFHQLEIYII